MMNESTGTRFRTLDAQTGRPQTAGTYSSYDEAAHTVTVGAAMPAVAGAGGTSWAHVPAAAAVPGGTAGTAAGAGTAAAAGTAAVTHNPNGTEQAGSKDGGDMRGNRRHAGRGRDIALLAGVALLFGLVGGAAGGFAMSMVTGAGQGSTGQQMSQQGGPGGQSGATGEGGAGEGGAPTDAAGTGDASGSSAEPGSGTGSGDNASDSTSGAAADGNAPTAGEDAPTNGQDTGAAGTASGTQPPAAPNGQSSTSGDETAA